MSLRLDRVVPIVLLLLTGFALILLNGHRPAGAQAESCTEAAEPGMDEVVRLQIGPDQALTVEPNYELDDRQNLTAVGRVTYCLEVGGDFVAATFDAPHADPALLGLPVSEAATVRQRTAVTVQSNLAGVPVGDDLVGSIEFYPNAYSAPISLGVPGASSDLFDADDTPGAGRYGALQIHLSDIESNTSEPVLAWNGWATLGVDDLGLGTPNGGSPDWTSAGNADVAADAALRIFASEAVGQITDPGAMQTGAIVPRAAGEVSGTTEVRGIAPGADQVRASSEYNGDPKRSRIRPVAADGTFVIPLSVPTRQRSHTAFIDVRIGGQWQRLYSVADVAGGDVYLIQGQSNAVARVFGGGEGLETLSTPWIRTFGSTSITRDPLAMSWTRAVASTNAYAVGGIGQWGMQLGSEVTQTTGVPIAIMNGAHGGRPASFFQRNPANPLDPATNYGRFLERLQRAGVDAAARGFGWYQGENDWQRPDEHEVMVNALFDSWKLDLPELETIHLIQIHNGCQSRDIPDGDLEVRERQRRIAVARPEVQLVSTAALPDHDGCHYLPSGYAALGSQMAQLVQRDVLGGVVSSGVDSPTALSSSWLNEERTKLRVHFVRMHDLVLGNSTTDFSITDANVNVVQVIDGVGHLDLVLDGPAAAGSTLRYLGVFSPFPTTPWGAGIAAFDHLEIAAFEAPPIVGCQVGDGIVQWEAVDGVDTYQLRQDGQWLATVTGLSYSVDTTNHEYLVRHRLNGQVVDIVCDQDVPPAPSCSVSPGRLDWDAIPGAATYQIRRDGSWLTSTTDTFLVTQTAGHEFVVRYWLAGQPNDLACVPG